MIVRLIVKEIAEEEKSSCFTTPDGRQSKTLMIIDEHGSKIVGIGVFDCKLQLATNGNRKLCL